MTETADTDRIRLTIAGHVATITLHAPAQHNALEARDVRALHARLDAVEAVEEIRVLVLTGSGEETFCAGASLSQMESGEMTPELFETFTDRLASLRVPTVCALNGSVYGGGAEIAMCCDFRVGVEGSRLSVPAAGLGVCYPVGGLARYQERLGLQTAKRILLLADELNAEEMLQVGFLTQLVGRTELVREARELAEHIARQAPLAVQAMKKILNQVAAGSVDAEEALALVERCSSSADLKEGLRAKREGRDPAFEGH